MTAKLSLAARAPWLAPFFHHVRELGEQIMRIVRSGRRLGVILHAEQWRLLVAHAFARMVVQVDMRDFHVARRKRVRIDRETMILRGNLHLFGQQILHRMIRAVVPKFQLEGFAAKSQPAKLMSQANPKDGYLPNELANGFDSVPDRLRVARPVRKKYAVRLYSQCVLGRSLRRHDPHVAIVVHEQPQNVLLDAVIKRQHTMLVTLTLRVRLAHLLDPRGNRHFDRSFLPAIRLRASYPTR